MTRTRYLAVATLTFLLLPFWPVCASADPTFVGPTPYLCSTDSPFNLSAPNVCLEDFEDGMLNTPGVTGNGSVISPSGITDSVDCDDGTIDGSGAGGHSYFGDGATGITFTFDPGAPLGLPTQAGAVWTDGSGTVSFEAFGPDGTSLGVIGPFDHPDGSITGETAEDRFYGVTNAAGISAIKLTNTFGGIEVDHLQYNNCLAAGTTTTETTTTTTSTTSTSTTSTTTTTSTTSTRPTTSTTSTTLPSTCAGVPEGPTFVSIDCRLAALLAQVTASTELGPQQTKLRQEVEKAKERKEQAETVCAEPNLRRTRKKLTMATKKMVQAGKTLRNKQARKSIPDALRNELSAAADGVETDLRTLRGAVRCPDDAPPIPLH